MAAVAPGGRIYVTAGVADALRRFGHGKLEFYRALVGDKTCGRHMIMCFRSQPGQPFIVLHLVGTPQAEGGGKDWACQLEAQPAERWKPPALFCDGKGLLPRKFNPFVWLRHAVYMTPRLTWDEWNADSLCDLITQHVQAFGR